MADQGEYVMPTPTHATAWRSHLAISHCVVIPGGKQGDACDFEALHDELHTYLPGVGAIPHRHSAPAAPAPGADHGFW